MANVLTPAGGIFRRLVEPGQEVEYGQKLGVILDPFTAKVEADITCPTSGGIAERGPAAGLYGNSRRLPNRWPACKKDGACNRMERGFDVCSP